VDACQLPYSVCMAEAPLLVIVGETASGKSALALELAQKFGGEIICADSSTIRRELNIGSAKPSEKERALVPHHLLDIIGPDEKFTAAQFQKLAKQAISEISSRGKLPIMVGGSGLYIDSVVYDYSFFGKGEAIDRKEMRTDTLVLGINIDRDELRERISKRADEMLAAGLESEVHGLAEQFGWGSEALKGVGYSQWRGYFEASQTVSETRQKIIKATMDLAKRQRTWFKRNKSIQWFTTPVKRTEVVDCVTTFLAK
jgi:tRNA dimethylallyltransferase